MQDHIHHKQAPRINRATAMINAADDLVQSGNSDSALLLYVTALEIVGEALITHNRLGSFMTKGIRKHQARHFVAATLLPGVLFTETSSLTYRSLDFSKIRYETFEEVRDGKTVKVWVGKGDKGPALNILNGLHGEADRSDWSVEALRIFALLSFWRDSVFGHWDNYRLALIHQDNNFEFLEYDHAGQVR